MQIFLYMALNGSCFESAGCYVSLSDGIRPIVTMSACEVSFITCKLCTATTDTWLHRR